MTTQKLASEIAKIEGKKSKARIGDIREIIKIIQIMLKEEIKNFSETKQAPVSKVLFSKTKPT